MHNKLKIASITVEFSRKFNHFYSLFLSRCSPRFINIIISYHKSHKQRPLSQTWDSSYFDFTRVQRFSIKTNYPNRKSDTSIPSCQINEVHNRRFCCFFSRRVFTLLGKSYTNYCMCSTRKRKLIKTSITFASCSNQSINLRRKLINWFLHVWNIGNK